MVYSGSGLDYGGAVVVDSARNAYVSGYTYGGMPGATSLGASDSFLMKYDKDGVQQWLIQFGTTTTEQAFGLQVDSNDMLYATLYTAGSMEGENLGSTDMVVMQVDSTGSVLWTEQFGTSGFEKLPNGGNPVAVDSTGDVFITGYTSGSFTGYSNQGSNDWFLYKVDATRPTTSSTSSTTSTSITATTTTSSSSTSDTITLSTTSTGSSSSTGTVTSTSTSSRTLAAVAK